MYSLLITAIVIFLIILSSSQFENFSNEIDVPFEEYWTCSTLLSNSDKRAKRKLSCEFFHIDLKHFAKITLCLFRKTVMAYNFMNYNSKFIIHEEDGSVNLTAFSHLNYTILRGYVMGYENSSKVSGLLYKNKQFIGTIDVNGTIFYVEDLKDYEIVHQLKLQSNDIASASIIYKRVSSGGFYCPGEAQIPRWKVKESVNKWCTNLQKHNLTLTKRKISDYSGVEVPIAAYMDTSYFKFAMSSDEDKSVYSVFKSIESADAVFRSADFTGNGKPDNVGFKIMTITLYKQSAASHLPEFYPFRRDSTTHLQKFDAQVNDAGSRNLKEKSILNILYTGQPFQDGVIGVSYGASTQIFLDEFLSASTNYYVMKLGLCSQIRSSITPPGLYESVEMKINQYNSIIVTGHSGYTIKLSQLQLDLTLVHELGHAFGARHDDLRRCGQGFVMSDHVEKWKSGNMHRFSRCSLDQINGVLMDRHAGCLSPPSLNKPICGNKIKEGGEQCDCGDRYECAYTRSCCFPHGSRLGLPCTINPNCK